LAMTVNLPPVTAPATKLRVVRHSWMSREFVTAEVGWSCTPTALGAGAARQQMGNSERVRRRQASNPSNPTVSVRHKAKSLPQGRLFALFWRDGGIRIAGISHRGAKRSETQFMARGPKNGPQKKKK
jgi:hypothetical protein